MKRLAIVIVMLFGALLVFCAEDFPPWGDPTSPPNTHVSPRYIERTMAETSVPNIVTAVLADYRGYDTLFETIVIFTAGVACVLLLRMTRRLEPGTRLYRHIPSGITFRIRKKKYYPQEAGTFERIDLEWVPYDIIIQTGCRVIVPISQIFALYVIAHGHYSPGGGFQGGVILGAAVILYAVSHNLYATVIRYSEKTAAMLCGLGVVVYTGTGALCMLNGANFLDHGALAGILGVDAVAARSYGILLVEFGVGMAVMAVIVHIYYNLASVGKHDEGL